MATFKLLSDPDQLILEQPHPLS